jgi:hypothetical protein
VRAALQADIARAHGVNVHNVNSSEDEATDRPRAFIRFSTEPYEVLLFSGQLDTLASEETLVAAMEYLNQAKHLNEMISIFEQMEVQFAGASNAPLGPKKQAYVRAIHDACLHDVPAAIQNLERCLVKE